MASTLTARQSGTIKSAVLYYFPFTKTVTANFVTTSKTQLNDYDETQPFMVMAAQDYTKSWSKVEVKASKDFESLSNDLVDGYRNLDGQNYRGMRHVVRRRSKKGKNINVSQQSASKARLKLESSMFGLRELSSIEKAIRLGLTQEDALVLFSNSNENPIISFITLTFDKDQCDLEEIARLILKFVNKVAVKVGALHPELVASIHSFVALIEPHVRMVASKFRYHVHLAIGCSELGESPELSKIVEDVWTKDFKNGFIDVKASKHGILKTINYLKKSDTVQTSDSEEFNVKTQESGENTGLYIETCTFDEVEPVLTKCCKTCSQVVVSNNVKRFTRDAKRHVRLPVDGACLGNMFDLICNVAGCDISELQVQSTNLKGGPRERGVKMYTSGIKDYTPSGETFKVNAISQKEAWRANLTPNESNTTSMQETDVYWDEDTQYAIERFNRDNRASNINSMDISAVTVLPDLQGVPSNNEFTVIYDNPDDIPQYLKNPNSDESRDLQKRLVRAGLTAKTKAIFRTMITLKKEPDWLIFDDDELLVPPIKTHLTRTCINPLEITESQVYGSS
jgi:hypothetical protein